MKVEMANVVIFVQTFLMVNIFYILNVSQSVSITCFLTDVVFGLLHSAYCTHHSELVGQ